MKDSCYFCKNYAKCSYEDKDSYMRLKNLVDQMASFYLHMPKISIEVSCKEYIPDNK